MDHRTRQNVARALRAAATTLSARAAPIHLKLSDWNRGTYATQEDAEKVLPLVLKELGSWYGRKMSGPGVIYSNKNGSITVEILKLAAVTPFGAIVLFRMTHEDAGTFYSDFHRDPVYRVAQGAINTSPLFKRYRVESKAPDQYDTIDGFVWEDFFEVDFDPSLWREESPQDAAERFASNIIYKLGKEEDEVTREWSLALFEIDQLHSSGEYDSFLRSH